MNIFSVNCNTRNLLVCNLYRILQECIIYEQIKVVNKLFSNIMVHTLEWSYQVWFFPQWYGEYLFCQKKFPKHPWEECTEVTSCRLGGFGSGRDGSIWFSKIVGQVWSGWISGHIVSGHFRFQVCLGWLSCYLVFKSFRISSRIRSG
jgi:hypothetical protein